MKTSLIFFIPVIVSIPFYNTAKASHVLAGQITAEPVAVQQYTYLIKFTLYTDAGINIDVGNYEINYGDGTTSIHEYQDFEVEYIHEDSLVIKNTLAITHTFPGPGAYVISFQEFNRTGEIINMYNSVSTPFYIETQLTVDPAIGENSTPVLSDAVVLTAHVKTRFVHDIGASDADDDSLSYQLVVPRQSREYQVEGYNFPDQLDIAYAESPGREDGSYPPIFAIENGQLIWDAPSYGGWYAAAFQAKEWRQVNGEWKEIGYVTRDLSILVYDTIHHTQGSDYYIDKELPDLVLFPNPNAGKFKLKTTAQWHNSLASIIDIIGREIYQTRIGQEISVFHLPYLSQ